MPFFSIVVPMYHAENTIERCVKSLTGQTFRDLEILLVNDGSTDGTESVCRTLLAGDERISYFAKRNEGVSAARNYGIQKATGKYLLFVDSDDYLQENYCEKLYHAWEKNSGVFFWTAIQIKSENGKVPENKFAYGEGNAFTDKNHILALMSAHFLNSPCNKMYELRLINKYGIRMPEGISIAEDLLFNLQYLDAEEIEEICILNDAEYIYVRNGDESLDNRYHADYYAVHKQAFDMLRELLKKWDVWEENRAAYREHYWRFLEDALRNNMRQVEKQNYRERIKSNDKILKEPFFQELLFERKGRMSRSTYWCYRLKKYALLRFYQKLHG